MCGREGGAIDGAMQSRAVDGTTVERGPVDRGMKVGAGDGAILATAGAAAAAADTTTAAGRGVSRKVLQALALNEGYML